MIKRHLKRLAVPKSWNVKRKGIKFISRPIPGTHSYDEGLSMNVILKDLLHYAHTTRESKKILINKTILIDGVRRKNQRFIVGLMDVISISELKTNYRVLIRKNGKLTLIKIDEKEAKIKPCKIVGKTLVKDKIQLNLFDGRNILVDKKSQYRIGDTVVIEVPSQKIVEHFKLERNALVFITKGKKVGDSGKVENISQREITCKKESGEIIETRKQYVFVVGKEKPIIKLEEK